MTLDMKWGPRAMPRARDSLIRSLPVQWSNGPLTKAHLAQARLMWVTAEMVEHLRPEIESDGAMSQEVDLESPIGLMGIEESGLRFPFTYDERVLAKFEATTGGSALVPLAALSWHEMAGDRCHLSCYYRPTAPVREFMKQFVPHLARTELVFFENAVLDGEHGVTVAQRITRLACTVLRVAQEERIAAVTRLSETADEERPAPRRVRDRDDVRVISLRRPARGEPEGAGTGKPWDYRTKVKRHTRTYWVGVGRTERVTKVIEEYVAGPEGAPLREPRERVYALRR